MNTENFYELCYLYFFNALDENEKLEFIFNFVSEKSTCRIIFTEIKDFVCCLSAAIDTAEPPASLKEEILQQIRAVENQEIIVS